MTELLFLVNYPFKKKIQIENYFNNAQRCFCVTVQNIVGTEIGVCLGITSTMLLRSLT